MGLEEKREHLLITDLHHGLEVMSDLTDASVLVSSTYHILNKDNWKVDDTDTKRTAGAPPAVKEVFRGVGSIIPESP